MSESSEKASVEKPSFWIRLIPMIIFAISLWLSFYVLLLVAAIQFIWVAINDEPNDHLSRFTNSLSTWMKDTASFLGYTTEDKPFPWTGWPEAEVTPNLTDEPVVQPEPKAAAKPRAKPKTTRKPRAKPKPKAE